MENYTQKCPYCQSSMECDMVDIGIGFQQCGPFHCESCGASEIGPEATWPRSTMVDRGEIDEQEAETGFYKNKVSPYANTFHGEIVDHKTAKKLYEFGLLDKNEFAPQEIEVKEIPF